MELYESSEAMIAYMERGAGDKFKPPYPYSLDRMEVFGKVSDTLRKRLDSGKSKPQYFDHFDGFTRWAFLSRLSRTWPRDHEAAGGGRL